MSDKLEKAVEQIAEKRELPSEVKDKIDINVFKNSIIAIVCMVILIIINTLYMFVNGELFSIITKSFSLIGIISVIVFCELAYRKDSNYFWILGIEFFVLSTLIMFIPYIYNIFDANTISIIMTFPVIFAIYFTFKSIYFYIKLKKDYLNNISDVKEILQEEELDSYLEEKSTKTLKAKKEKKKKQEEKVKEKVNQANNKQEVKKQVKKQDNKVQEAKVQEKKKVNKGGK